MKIDRQKTKVYKWEEQVVSPFDKTAVPFVNIESIVQYVWLQEGLSNPPMVEPLDLRSHNAGDGTRIKVRFKPQTHTWIILHELAHSITSLASGESNWHGSLFMGVYCRLLSKYLNLNFEELVESAQKAGLKVDANAIPAWIET